MKMKNQHIIPGKEHQPFKVPDGFFESFESRMKERIISEVSPKKGRKVHLKPFIALAASITGIALVTYLVLQSIPDSYMGDSSLYDIELLDETGIILDEAAIADYYGEMEEDNYSEWDEDAMTFLASNEVELLMLME